MFPADVKSKDDMALHGEVGHDLLNGHSSNDLDELEDEEDSDSSSPPLPYLQTPAPDGCCTLDGIISTGLLYKRKTFSKTFSSRHSYLYQNS